MDSKVLHEYLELFQFIAEPKGCQKNKYKLISCLELEGPLFNATRSA